MILAARYAAPLGCISINVSMAFSRDRSRDSFSVAMVVICLWIIIIEIDELLGLLVVGWIGSGAGCFGMVWALGTGALAPIFFYK